MNGFDLHNITCILMEKFTSSVPHSRQRDGIFASRLWFWKLKSPPISVYFYNLALRILAQVHLKTSTTNFCSGGLVQRNVNARKHRNAMLWSPVVQPSAVGFLPALFKVHNFYTHSPHSHPNLLYNNTLFLPFLQHVLLSKDDGNNGKEENRRKFVPILSQKRPPQIGSCSETRHLRSIWRSQPCSASNFTIWKCNFHGSEAHSFLTVRRLIQV